MAPFFKILVSGFAYSSSWRKNHHHHHGANQFRSSSCFLRSSIGSGNNVEEEMQVPTTLDLSELLSLLGAASPLHLLRLETNPETGVRGIYINNDNSSDGGGTGSVAAVARGSILLKIPLASCLRDDEPPAWLPKQQQNNDDDDDNGPYASSSPKSEWVTRLTAALLEVQFQQQQTPLYDDDKKSKAMRLWLALLPTNLRDLLPIHWMDGNNNDDDADTTIHDEKMQQQLLLPLEMAVDAAYFSRAGLVAEILAAANNNSNSNNILTQRQVEDALDLVQTRSCRAQTLMKAAAGSCNGDNDIEVNNDQQHRGTGNNNLLRVLVPVFDLINHSHSPNAEFFRQDDYMVVRSTREIPVGNEVLINYGSASTVPAWRCLLSYGFVPLSSPAAPEKGGNNGIGTDTTTEGVNEEEEWEKEAASYAAGVHNDEVAELILVDDENEDGTVVQQQQRVNVGPTEIPFEMLEYESKLLGQEQVELNSAVGCAIVNRLVRAANQLKKINLPPPDVASIDSNCSKINNRLRVITDLQESNRRTLLVCAKGLRNYLEENNLAHPKE